MKILLKFLILFFTFNGCTNKSQQQVSKNTDSSLTELSNDETIESAEEFKKDVLNKIYEDALNRNMNQYDLIRIPEIKDMIIDEYSDRFYEKVLKYSEVVTPIKYDSATSTYQSEGWVTHLSSYGSTISYNAKEFTVELRIADYTANRLGELDYGNWEKEYYLNDFDEQITDKPYIQLDTENDNNETLHLRFNKDEGFSFWITGKYISFYPHKIDLKIKHNDDIYLVDIDKIVKTRVFIYNNGIQTLAQLLYLEDGESMISIFSKDILGEERHYLFKMYHPTHFGEALTLLDKNH